MFCIGDKVEMRGVIGQSFLATINGELVTIPINVETKFGIIANIVPGLTFSEESEYMIKFMHYTYPMKVDEDYIMAPKCHCCHTQCCWHYY